MENRLAAAAPEENQIAGLGIADAPAFALLHLFASGGRKCDVEIVHDVTGEAGAVKTRLRLFARRGVFGAFVFGGVGHDVFAERSLAGGGRCGFFGGFCFGEKFAVIGSDGEAKDYQPVGCILKFEVGDIHAKVFC